MKEKKPVLRDDPRDVFLPTEVLQGEGNIKEELTLVTAFLPQVIGPYLHIAIEVASGRVYPPIVGVALEKAIGNNSDEGWLRLWAQQNGLTRDLVPTKEEKAAIKREKRGVSTEADENILYYNITAHTPGFWVKYFDNRRVISGKDNQWTHPEWKELARSQFIEKYPEFALKVLPQILMVIQQSLFDLVRPIRNRERLENALGVEGADCVLSGKLRDIQEIGIIYDFRKNTTGDGNEDYLVRALDQTIEAVDGIEAGLAQVKLGSR